MPLVKGARATTEESILNAYSGDSIDVKREQGEDYWVDPSLLRVEQSEQEQRAAAPGGGSRAPHDDVAPPPRALPLPSSWHAGPTDEARPR